MTPGDGVADERIDVLLVEPNPGDARLVTESFADGKLVNRLHTVTDGESALDFVQRRGEYAEKPLPNLILLEPRLPGTSGQDIPSALNDEPALADIPVVVLTSSDIGEEIARSHDLDADDYIQKPIDPDDFIVFVQSVEEFWLAVVERPAPTTRWASGTRVTGSRLPRVRCRRRRRERRTRHR